MKYTTLFAALLGCISVATANQISEDQRPFIEKYKKQKHIIAADEALINTEAEPALSEGFTDLYNGKNLDGWTPLGGFCEFEATPEAIIGKHVKDSPSTYLSTVKNDYADFIFTAEIKWAVDGNTGIIFRGQEKRGRKGVTAMGPQAEMEGFEGHDGLRKWSGGIYGQDYAAWIYPLWLDAHQEARAALKKDAWNRITIKAVGSDIKTWVNGVPAAHYIESHGFKKGFFSLQVHSGPKGEIHFRNIKVKELQDGYTDLFASGDFSLWQQTNGKPINPGWTIEDGVIYRGGARPGSIVTKQEYKNFDLRFDWKISEGGNSGVKYRTRGSLGLEYQVLDDGVHKDKNLSAGIYALVPAAEDKPFNPSGQWNSGRILIQGDHVEHWINGVKVAEVEIGSEDWKERFQKSKYSKHEGFGTWTGPILLQDHADEVWYRNVRIKEL